MYFRVVSVSTSRVTRKQDLKIIGEEDSSEVGTADKKCQDKNLSQEAQSTNHRKGELQQKEKRTVTRLC